jgi:hypothetical protein
MLGIVAIVGGILLIKGIQVMTQFNADVAAQNARQTEKVHEKIVITHVRFFMDEDQSDDEIGHDDEDDSDGDDGADGEDDDVINEPVARIYLINVGDVDSYISFVSIINSDEQTLDCCTAVDRTYLPIRIPVTIQVKLDQNYITDDTYKVSIITEQDNSFTKLVTPPNG